jgi:5-methylthioadenosine/S-adenosylhomocysteine deaminase
LLKRGRRLADEYGVGIHIHTAQSRTEVNHIRKTLGRSGSLEYLNDLGFLGDDVIAVHCTYVTDEGIRLMAETDTKYAICPSRFLRPGRSRPTKPLLEMLEAGVITGLGTDWIRMDPWERMRAALRITGEALGPTEVLRLATTGSARALGMEQEVGSLEVGKKADIILVDMQRPHLVPTYEDSLITELVHHVSGQDVETVIVDGQIILDRGAFQTVDEDAVLKEAQRTCDVVRRLASEKLGL